MPTECNATLFEFEAIEGRAVVAGFDGGDITSRVRCCRDRWIAAWA